MKLGAMDVVLGSNLQTVFERAKRLGLDAVEVNLKVKPLVAGDFSAVDAAIATAQRAQLPICSTVLGEHNGGGLATWWRGADAADEIIAAIEATRRLGCRDLLVPFFFFNEPKGRTHRMALAERLKPVMTAAQRADVRVCFEGVLSAVHMLELFDAVNHPLLGCYYDPANATWCDYDIVAEVRLLGAKLFRSHIKEAVTYTSDGHAGAGRVNHTGYAAALREIGYSDWLVMETPLASDEATGKDIVFARRVYG